MNLALVAAEKNTNIVVVDKKRVVENDGRLSRTYGTDRGIDKKIKELSLT